MLMVSSGKGRTEMCIGFTVMRSKAISVIWCPSSRALQMIGLGGLLKLNRPIVDLYSRGSFACLLAVARYVIGTTGRWVLGFIIRGSWVGICCISQHQARAGSKTK